MKATFCMIAFGLMTGSILTSLSCMNCPLMVKYRESLDKELAEKNKQIIQERVNIYYMGVVIGLISS